MVLSNQEEEECIKLMKKSVLLRRCNDDYLRILAKFMEKKNYNKGSILIKEGEPQTRMFIIAKGNAIREKVTEDGRKHQIDTNLGGATVGSLHVMNKDPAYATTKCVTDVTTYELTSENFNYLFKTNPDFAWSVAYSLSLEIRNYTRSQRTPLLAQHGKKTPYLSVSIAAGIESFYRAALNALLNQQLTGIKRSSLFPNMHIQIPTRIVYINGFKGIRQYLDNKINPENYSNPTAVSLLAAVTPGVAMTPVSSILEACNAGHSNPEPLTIRWIRGIIPRSGREIIFGVGLNQLTDYCEERVPFFENKILRNATGSLTAGVISGYFSHVVHNLSTLKLMQPQKSYWKHFREYCQKAESRLPTNISSPFMKKILSTFIACVFPSGVIIRTTQIVGSFIILNGTITILQKWVDK